MTLQRSPLNQLRISGVFPYEAWGKRRIDVAGVGALGSNLALDIATTVPFPGTVHVYDHDRVEPHNVPNTVYYQSQAILDENGRGIVRKVDALQRIVAEKCFLSDEELARVLRGEAELDPSKSIVPHYAVLGDETPPELQGDADLEINPDLEGEVVFLMVDCMPLRKKLVEYISEECPFTHLIIEGRMGKTTGRIFTIDPHDPEDVKFWMENWYPQPTVQADATTCQQDPTLKPAVNALVATAMFQFYRYARRTCLGEELDLERELVIQFERLGILQF